MTLESTATPGAAIATLEHAFPAAHDSSLVAVGTPGAVQILALADDNRIPISGTARTRFVNASSDNAAYDVYVGDQKLFTALPPRTASTYVNLVRGHLHDHVPRSGERRDRADRRRRRARRRARGDGLRGGRGRHAAVDPQPRALALEGGAMLLMIDNYDSFTYNLVQYLGELGADVHVVRNDAITLDADRGAGARADRRSRPGPCTPNEAGDLACR